MQSEFIWLLFCFSEKRSDSIGKTHYTDEHIFEMLRTFYILNGRRPYQKDFSNTVPNYRHIARRFSTWLKAVEEAGIPKGKYRESDYNKQEMISFLHEYYEKNNKVPTTRGLSSQGYPNAHAYINHFGSFKNALIEAGLFELRDDRHQFAKEYTDEELLCHLRKYMSKKQRIPTLDTMKKEMIPSVSTYNKRLGGVYKALKTIGYDIGTQMKQDRLDLKEKMKESYIKLHSSLGYVPSSRDIEKQSRSGRGYAMKTYETYFGSLYELQIECGFTPTKIGRNKTREDLIDGLIMLKNKLGRTPSRNDLIHYDYIASSGKYEDEFGSWNQAVEEAGLELNNKNYFSTNGLECLSHYELSFTNMLEKYKITFSTEDSYSDYIETNRRYRFDYIVEYMENSYFVEIFGVEHNKNYDMRKEEKIQLCKSNGIPLIELYPKDFSTNGLDEIYEVFIKKIKGLHLEPIVM